LEGQGHQFEDCNGEGVRTAGLPAQ
jgi:hypothetical protein